MKRIAIAAGLALAALVPATAFAHEPYCYAPAVYYGPRYHDDDYWREREHYWHERHERERHYWQERRERERHYWHERREWERYHYYRDYD